MVKIFSLLTLFLIGSVVTAEDLPRTITVTGQGKASSPPDMATINVGVVSMGKTAKQALATNNQSMQNIMSTLKGKNIAEQDIQTSGFNVYPEYDRIPAPQGTAKTNRIAGYRVSNSVSVKVRNLPQLGEVLDALVQSGSNQISGVQFGIADPNAVSNKARVAAVADALARAQLYAAATNVSVGQVISISEQAIQAPRPMMMRAARMEMASSIPIATGEQEITASVNIMYELK